MSDKDDGFAAFPHGEVHDDSPPYRHMQASKGMSIRDYFSAKAMQGMLAYPGEAFDMNYDEIARAAFLQSDAMIKARKS